MNVQKRLEIALSAELETAAPNFVNTVEKFAKHHKNIIKRVVWEESNGLADIEFKQGTEIESKELHDIAKSDLVMHFPTSFSADSGHLLLVAWEFV